MPRRNGIALEEKGHGTPLVFLHGLGMDRRIWTPFMDALAGEFRCIAVDLPGHGNSADLAATGDYEFQAVAERIHHALRQSDIADPVIIGHSMGAVVASFYAVRFPVRAVVNIDQFLDIRATAGLFQGMTDVLRGPDFPDLWRRVRASFGLEKLPVEAQQLEEKVSNPRQAIVLSYWDGLLTTAPAQYQDYIDDHIRAIRVPYTAFHGVLPTPDYKTWLGQRIPQAECIEIGVPCHFPHFVAPQTLISTLRDAGRRA